MRSAALQLLLLYPTASTAVDINLMLLQRMSDTRTSEASCTTGWSATKSACYLDESWKAVAMTGLQAILDFNERNPTYVAAFGQLGACDKHFNVSVEDSMSTANPATRALLDALGGAGVPDMIIGPGRSAASQPTAAVGGVLDIPQVSYWSTSKALDDLDDYPRFMRTLPNDDAIAYSVCQFWREDMGYTVAAMIYSNDAYGEAYKESLLDHCLTQGVVVTTFPYDASDLAAARGQVGALAATNLRVVLWVGSQQGLPTILDEAYKQDLLGGAKGAMWLFTDGASPSDLVT